MPNSAAISDCGTWRWRLDREVQAEGIVIAYFGVNGSTATGEIDDQTVKKWIGFTLRNGGRRFIAGNVFGFRATDVRELAAAPDPVGPLNDAYLIEIMAEADLLVPCWGSRDKLPPKLHARLDLMRALIENAGKPVATFGLTKSGDPKHPQMLGYDIPLIW